MYPFGAPQVCSVCWGRGQFCPNCSPPIDPYQSPSWPSHHPYVNNNASKMKIPQMQPNFNQNYQNIQNGAKFPNYSTQNVAFAQNPSSLPPPNPVHVPKNHNHSYGRIQQYPHTSNQQNAVIAQNQQNQISSAQNNVLSVETRLVKIDMAGHAWAVIKNNVMYNPIFIPPIRMNGAKDGDEVSVIIKQRADGKLYAKVDQILIPNPISHFNHNLHDTGSSGVIQTPSDQVSASKSSIPVNHLSHLVNNLSVAPYPQNQPNTLPNTSPNLVYPSDKPNKAHSSSFVYPKIQDQQHSSSPYYNNNNNNYNNVEVPRSASSPHIHPQNSASKFDQQFNFHQPQSVPSPHNPNNSSSNIRGYNQPQYYPPQSSHGPSHSSSGIGSQFVASNDSRAHLRPPNNPNSPYQQHSQHPQHQPVVQNPHQNAIVYQNSSRILDGVLTVESADLAFVVPDSASEETVSIPKEYMNGAQHGDIVRAQIIPQKSNHSLIGAIMCIISRNLQLNPSTTEPTQNIEQTALMTIYPELEDYGVYNVDKNHRESNDNIKSPSMMDIKSSSSSSSLSSLSSPSISSPSLSSRLSLIGGLQSDEFLRVLKTQFSSINKNQMNSRCSQNEFVVSLDVLGEVPMYSQCLWKGLTSMNAQGPQIAKTIPFHAQFDDYVLFTKVLIDGSEKHQLALGFNQLNQRNLPSLTKDDFFQYLSSVFKLLLNLRLPIYLVGINDLCDRFWSIFCPDSKTNVDFATFAETASKRRLELIGLGLAQMPKQTPPHLHRSGFPLCFGNSSWPVAFQMMVGLSRAIHSFNDDESISSASFRVTSKFELHTTLKNNTKLTFIDYAPSVFKKIRSLRNIDNPSYLYSLGVEQLLGNLMLGRLTSFSKQLSTGKSGQFFFTSHDGRFLLKTIAAHERNMLYKLLPGYLDHLTKYPSSLLVPIYGLHEIGQTCFIVMGNVFNTKYQMDACWDLKGSHVGRSAPNSFVKKDLDFDRGFMFGQNINSELIKQIRIDALFLKSMNIVDYSLLVGYHKLTKQELAEEDAITAGNPAIHPYHEQGLRWINQNGQKTEEIWFMGIVDILIQFGALKKAENFFKSLIHNPDSISIVHPDQYADRFSNYLASSFR